MNEPEARYLLDSLVTQHTIYSEQGFSVHLEKDTEKWDLAISFLGPRRAYRLMAEHLCGVYAEKYARPYLFHEGCVAYELGYHINAYLSMLGCHGYHRHITTLIFTKKQLIDHCQSVEISTGDVHDLKQRVMFRYRTGIRPCYRRTADDPYATAYEFLGGTRYVR